VIHGDRDTLAPLADARLFVERLRAVSRASVLYVELRGAQHAFDVFVSPRSAPVIEGVERFLAAVHTAHRAAMPSGTEPEPLETERGQAYEPPRAELRS
jgi:acetyl esterase/lipase